MLLLWLVAIGYVDGLGVFETMRAATMATLLGLLVYWAWDRLRSG
jgi:hypothetical protein